MTDKVREEVHFVLPKQWKNWVRSARLGLGKPIKKWDRNMQHHWINLVGRGHRWRINMYGEFQCGDTLEEFDRWALSNNVFVDIRTIQNRDQFVNIVKQLVKFHESTFPGGRTVNDDQDRNIEMEVV